MEFGDFRFNEVLQDEAVLVYVVGNTADEGSRPEVPRFAVFHAQRQVVLVVVPVIIKKFVFSKVTRLRK